MTISPEAFVPEPADVPSEQRWAFEDGEVTEEEYAEGFERFVACAEEQGGIVTHVGTDPETGRIRYMYPADEPTTPVVEDCYQRYWQDIDATFQTTDLEMVAEQQEEAERSYEKMRPCLEANGYEVPPYDPDGSHAELIMTYFDLSNAGLCGSDG